MSTYKFPNTIAVLEVNRKYLKLALERCASYFHIDNETISISNRFLKPKVQHYNYDYFNNIEYTFDLRKPVGSRVTSIKFKGQELSDNTSLSLVMNNYRATGAGGYEFLTECPMIKEIQCEMPEVIINYFRKHTNVQVDCTKYINVIY